MPLIELFQSTSPVRGTTFGHHIHRHCKNISIHVPREGDDADRHPSAKFHRHFNPRPP